VLLYIKATKRLLLATVLAAVFASQLLLAQSAPSFSGVWKQSNDRSEPKRKGDVTLKIDHRDPEFTVETTILRGSGSPRVAKQRYTTDGKPSTTTGADGDEFLTSIVWKGSELVFSIEEHEDGRTLRSTETWSLIEDGSALKRVRERSDGSQKQTLVYLRIDTKDTAQTHMQTQDAGKAVPVDRK
jgi:hypothetical protein